MVSIKIQKIKAAKALELVNELKEAGLILNQDFEWAFHNEQLHGSGKTLNMFCEFKFTDDKFATFYALKWQQQ